MRSFDEFRPAPPALPHPPVAVLQSQYHVRQHAPIGTALQAAVQWCRVRRPERITIALRTGLPSWLGHQAINRRWPLTVVAAADTLERTADDILPVLLELWVAADEQRIVSTPAERDSVVLAAAPELDIASILTTVVRSTHNQSATSKRGTQP